MEHIESIYYFDYTKDIGHYDSLRNLPSKEIQYIGLALSTPKVRINATPTKYLVNDAGSEQIREYVASHLSNLCEVDKEQAENSAEYTLICRDDGTKQYFEKSTELNAIFKLAEEFRIIERSPEPTYVSPYAIQKEDVSWTPPKTIQPPKGAVANKNTTTHQQKKRYCQQCGSVIDESTKTCTGCGKRYSKGGKIAVIVLASIVALLAVVILSNGSKSSSGNGLGHAPQKEVVSAPIPTMIINLPEPTPYYEKLGLSEEEYLLATMVAYDVDSYCEHMAELRDMLGKGTYGEDVQKELVIDRLNADETLEYGEKIILYRYVFPYDVEYCNDIVDYLNERDDVTYDEMVYILEMLGFAVFEDGTVKW